MFLGDRLFVKGYRRLQAGLNPEVEIGRYLTDVAQFPHCVPLAGSVEYVADDGRTATLALVQGYVANQGSGWHYTENYLGRYLRGRRARGDAPRLDDHGAYLALARTLGRRTGELHAAFARRTGDPAFDPEPFTAAEAAALVRAGARRRRRGPRPPAGAPREPASRGAARRQSSCVASRDALLARIARQSGAAATGSRTRLHGDYHLGQVLLVQNDFVHHRFRRRAHAHDRGAARASSRR